MERNLSNLADRKWEITRLLRQNNPLLALNDSMGTDRLLFDGGPHGSKARFHICLYCFPFQTQDRKVSSQIPPTVPLSSSPPIFSQ